ncbi:MAG: cytochrome c oxidase subunit 3 [Acidobacteriota bacterium]|nr:cytochrome c oxidase subunit 3 [Acidobacteriota bacterium]
MTLVRTRRQRAMFRFLLVDLAGFLILFFVYIYFRIKAPEWAGALHFASAIMAIAMTLFAGSASFTMAAAANAQVRNDLPLASRLIGATIGVWIMFLICDAMEWARLLFFERPPQIYAATFCVLSGFHALHLIAGLPYLLMLIVNLKRSDVGAAALFVHFTNVVWLMVFVSVYLLGTDLQGF